MHPTKAHDPDAPPLVTVIVPAFNYGRFVGETLASVRSQTLGRWECVVVDDGSTDDTAAVVQSFARQDPRIRLIRQPNRGQAAAKNAGLRDARGRFIQFLDADDLIEPAKLAAQSDFLQLRPEVDLVYGDCRFFRDDAWARSFAPSLDGGDHDAWPRIGAAGVEVLGHLIERNIMVVNAPLIRRELLERIGGADESLPRADDWDLWVRCALAGARFEHLAAPRAAALVRSHGTSLTRRDRRLLESSVRIHEKVDASAAAPPDLRRRNAAILSWLREALRAARQIDSAIPPGAPFVLIDDDRLRPELAGYPAVPFTERGGRYNGPPADDASAVDELRRTAESAGARHVVLAAHCLWYLDQYPGLARYLRERFQEIHGDGAARVFARPDGLNANR
jgi:GT2 family glycosyltransferase